MAFPFERPQTHGPQELAYLRTGEAPAPARDYWCYKVEVDTRTQALARSSHSFKLSLPAYGSSLLADAFFHLQRGPL